MGPRVIALVEETFPGEARYYIDVAKKDYRDIIYWAEYWKPSDVPETSAGLRKLGIDIPLQPPESPG